MGVEMTFQIFFHLGRHLLFFTTSWHYMHTSVAFFLELPEVSLLLVTLDQEFR